MTQVHFHNFHRRETITSRKQLVNRKWTKFMSRSSYTLIESEHFKLPLSSLDIGLLYLETIVQINQTGYACNLQPSAFQV